MMDYGEKVTADPSTFDDPQYMFLRERLKALKDGWEEVHQMWENRQVSVSSFLKKYPNSSLTTFLKFIFLKFNHRQQLLSQSLDLQMFNRDAKHPFPLF